MGVDRGKKELREHGGAFFLHNDEKIGKGEVKAFFFFFFERGITLPFPENDQCTRKKDIALKKT